MDDIERRLDEVNQHLADRIADLQQQVIRLENRISRAEYDIGSLERSR